MMKAFMSVSQAVRDTILMVLCAAMFLLNFLATWLVDAETLQRYKETHNDN